MDTRASTLSGAAAKLYVTILLNAPTREYSFESLTELTGLARQSLYQARDQLVTQGLVRFSTVGRAWVLEPTGGRTPAPVSPAAPVTAPVYVAPVVSSAPLPPKQSVLHETDRVRQVCTTADHTGEMDGKLEAMQQLWELLFPEKKWPANRLTARAARELLRVVNDSAEAAFDALSVILDGRKVMYPLAYVKSLLLSAVRTVPAEDGGAGDGVDLDPLRSWLRVQVEQGNSANGKSYLSPSGG